MRSLAAPCRPVLDVLIPHYADPAGLARTLGSVATQSWCEMPWHVLRVIVVDDGSPPQDLRAVEQIAAQFEQQSGQTVLLDRLAVNQGRPRARNRLLDLADAPYLAWLDAGDIWYPDKLAAQFAHLAAREAAGDDLSRLWVTCAYDWDQNGCRVARTQTVTGTPLRALLIGDPLRAYLWTLLGRAEAFAIAGRFDPNLPRLQDLDYFLTFVRAGGQITVPAAPDPLCCYFKSDLGRSAVQVAESYAHIMAKHAPVIRQYPRSLRSSLALKGPLLAARFARANGQRGLAAKYLFAAVRASPLRMARTGLRHLRARLSAYVRGQHG